MAFNNIDARGDIPPDIRDLIYSLKEENDSLKKRINRIERKDPKKNDTIARNIQIQNTLLKEHISLIEILKEKDKSKIDWRIFFDNAPVAIHIVRDTISIYANSKFLELFGYDNVDEIIGKDEAEFLHPEYQAESIQRSLDRQKGLDPSNENEIIIRKKDGTFVNVHVAATRVILEGKPAVMAYLFDISERVRAEKALKESEMKYTGILESSLNAIITINRDGKIIDYNTAAEDLFGYNKNEIIGNLIQNYLIPPELIEQESNFNQLMDTFLDVTPDKRIITTMLNKQRDEIPIELGFFKLVLDNGKQYFVGSIRDLTELNNSKSELKTLKQQLIQSQKLESLGLLASGIAHDFNNLLSIVLGNVMLLQLKLEDESELLQTVDEIIAVTHTASQLSDQLLTFAGRRDPNIQQLDLNEVISGMNKFLNLALKDNVELDQQLNPNISHIIGDRIQIQQLILNLITNAVDSIEANQGKIIIKTELITSNDIPIEKIYLQPDKISSYYVSISVSDNGTGIPPVIQDRIFDPFYTTKTRGRGLGLAVVLGIIKSHDGCIQLISEPNRGTTVIVYLPVE